jgi:O-antigen/teichoic acid export membrane protein
MVAADLLGRAFTLVALTAVARRVGKSAFGSVNLALGLLALLSLVADPGLQTVGQRRFVVAAEGERSRLMRVVVGLRLTLAVALCAATLLVVTVAGARIPASVARLLLPYAATLLPAAVALAWTYTASSQMQVVALATLVQNGLYAVWVLWRVHGPEDLVQVPVGLLLGTVASTVLQYAIAPEGWRRALFRGPLRRPAQGLPGAEVSPAAGLMREAAPFGFAFLLSQALVWIDSFVLAAFVDQAAVGIYHAAYRWILLVLGLATYVPQALFPKWAARRSPGSLPLGMGATMTLTWCGGAAVALALFGLAPPLVGVAFGGGYSAAVGVLRIQAVLVPLAMHNTMAVYYLYAMGRERWVLGLSLAVVASNALLNLWLVPRAGAAGAATALVATEVVSALLCTFAVVRSGAPWWRTYRFVWLDVGLLAAIVWVGRGWPTAAAAVALLANLTMLVVVWPRFPLFSPVATRSD